MELTPELESLLLIHLVVTVWAVTIGSLFGDILCYEIEKRKKSKNGE